MASEEEQSKQLDSVTFQPLHVSDTGSESSSLPEEMNSKSRCFSRTWAHVCVLIVVVSAIVVLTVLFTTQSPGFCFDCCLDCGSRVPRDLSYWSCEASPEQNDSNCLATPKRLFLRPSSYHRFYKNIILWECPTDLNASAVCHEVSFWNCDKGLFGLIFERNFGSIEMNGISSAEIEPIADCSPSSQS